MIDILRTFLVDLSPTATVCFVAVCGTIILLVLIRSFSSYYQGLADGKQTQANYEIAAMRREVNQISQRTSTLLNDEQRKNMAKISDTI